uniref:helix-turn-helix transcriptional regulator n=1 Tax=Haladaptatus sp. DJG-WS-42 TaxID=3120516 RepID=UPI00403F17BC
MRQPPLDILQFLVRSDSRATIFTTFTTNAFCTQSELQTETGIPRSTVSRIIGELESWI